MKENSSKRREWVKTAAIIFLSILLVLTFFSQTILNHSLPEVATKYVQNGTITSKIRGNGTVESGDPYVIEIPSQYLGRKVLAISHKVGDKVEKGEVLLTLSEGDGTELEAAKEALASAKDVLKQAQDAYDTAIMSAGITKEDISSAKSNVSAATYRQKITELQDSLKEAQEKVEPLETAVAQLEQAITDCSTQIGYEDQKKSLAYAKVTTATTVQQQAQDAQAGAAAAQEEAQGAVAAIQAESAALEASVAAGEVTEEEAAVQRVDIADRLAKANENLTQKQEALTKANEALNKANEDLASANKDKDEAEASQTTNIVSTQKAEYEISKYNYEKQLASAKDEVQKIQTELTDLVSKISDVTNLQELLDHINDAKKSVNEKQKKVDDLTAETGGSEIKSDITGTITAVNVTSGKTIETRDVIVLQPEGQGYYLSFSVSTEQSKAVSVGDKASLVNSWYYNDMDITLTSIKPDRTDPAKQKLLTFSVTGDVAVGQNLNVSVGQKSQNYDYIVPNSALRNDNNGDYILIVEAKSSPLGNRYIATRVDVQILAKDDTQSAINGALTGWEYVITTASAPIKAGDQVRISEN